VSCSKIVKGRKRPSKKQGGKANDPKISQEQGHEETSTDSPSGVSGQAASEMVFIQASPNTEESKSEVVVGSKPGLDDDHVSSIDGTIEDAVTSTNVSNTGNDEEKLQDDNNEGGANITEDPSASPSCISTSNVHSSLRRSPREHPTSSSNKRGGIIRGKNKFSTLTNDPDEGIGFVGLDIMKHIDHNLVVVQGGGTSDINGTYNKFSTHRDGSYQYSKDGPGPNKKEYSKIVRKEGQWCISYQQHVLYTNENSLGNEPPSFDARDNDIVLLDDANNADQAINSDEADGAIAEMAPVKPTRLTRRTRVKKITMQLGPCS
jgi:hypothetical protein